MKKIVLSIIIMIFFSTGITIAASPSPTTSSSPTEKPLPVSSATLEKAKELKEKVASKIAELKVLSKRGVIGTIKSIKDTSIILTSNGKDITIDTDDTTKITLLQKGKRSTLKLSDLKNDQIILVWGQYNKDQETLKAKQILSRVFSQDVIGTVKSIDKDNLTVLVKNDNKEQTFTITSATKKALKKDRNLTKAETTDISVGDYIHVYATNQTAIRLLVLPKTVLSSIAAETPKPSASPSPSPKPTTAPKSTSSATIKPAPTKTP